MNSSNRTHRPLKYRGFVVFIALTLMVLVSAAMLAIGETFSLDAHRTMDRTLQSQLDQMLIAGAAEASVHLATSVPLAVGASWDTNLPTSLSSQSARLQTTVISLDGADQAVLRIEARYADRQSGQTVSLARTNNGWKLAKVELIEPH